MTRAISDPAREVRLQAAIALSGFDGPAVAAALASALSDSEEAVAHAASDSLTELKDPKSADPLFTYFTHTDPFARMSAFRGVKELRRPEALKPAIVALNDPDASVREQAVLVIGWLKLEECFARLDCRRPRFGRCRAARGDIGAWLFEKFARRLAQLLRP